MTLRYSEALTVQVQPGFRSLIDQAATSRGAKPTEWVRGTLAEALRAAGFDPAQIPARDAGTLHNSQSASQSQET